MAKKKRSKSKKSPSTEVRRSGGQSGPGLPWLILGLLAIAFGVAAYLGWAGLQSGSIAGCGPDSGCSDVLSSRWSSWFGIPVSLLALPVYGLLFFSAARLGSAQRKGGSEPLVAAALAGSLVVMLAAVWFTAIQALVLGEFCPWCLTAHAAGFVASVLIVRGLAFKGAIFDGQPLPLKSAKLAAVGGWIGVTLLIAGQLVYKPDSFEVVAIAEDANEAGGASEKNQLWLHGGRFQLDVSEYPLVGKVDAGHYMLSLFDYTCHHCRSTHQQLKTLHDTFADDLAIVSLPLPLNPECNSLMRRMGREVTEAHQNACHYATLSLAVFLLKPSEWAGFDDWLFAGGAPPTIGASVERAAEIVGDMGTLQETMASQPVEDLIQLSVKIYEANLRTSGQGRMPQLVIGKAITTGAVDNVSKLYNLVGSHLGLRR